MIVVVQNKISLTREAMFRLETKQVHCSKLRRAANYLGQGNAGVQFEFFVTLDLSAVSFFATVYLGAVSK